MSMNFKRKLPIPKEIREEMPLSADMAARKEAFDAEVADALTGKSGKLLVVVGPCSADREDWPFIPIKVDSSFSRLRVGIPASVNEKPFSSCKQ